MGRLHQAAGVALAAVAASVANADLIDFEDSPVHGQIITTQYLASMGVTISADNPSKPFDYASIFDTRVNGSADPDLEGPPWSGGNLFASQPILGNILIVAENNSGAGDGILNNPDDEQLAGAKLMFSFNKAITTFGFDIIDVEGTLEENAIIDFFFMGQAIGQVMLSDFVTVGSDLFDPTIDFGDNTANRLAPIAASHFGAFAFDAVHITFGGSGGIDNIQFTTIPAPSALLVLAGLCVGTRRRRG